MPNQLTPATRQRAIHAMKRYGHSFICPYYGDKIIEAALINEYVHEVTWPIQKPHRGWRDIHLSAARSQKFTNAKERQNNLQLIQALEAVEKESPGVSYTWNGRPLTSR